MKAGFVFFRKEESLLLDVLERIKRNGDHDDDTFDDELDVGIPTDEVQAIGETSEDDDTDDRARDLADATIEGDTTDNTSRNSIKFVTIAGLGRA